MEDTLSYIMFMHRAKSKSFYRFVKEKGKPNPVGSYKFNCDVHLIGISCIACDSKEQRFNLMISEMPIINPLPIEFAGEKDEAGCGYFNWKGQIYFFIRLDTTKGILYTSQFLPEGVGFFIPKGKPIYFMMSSAKDNGVGGTFTLYYV